jgi:hypothetical protein
MQVTQVKVVGGGGRREIQVTCPGCDHVSQLPPAAVLRNNFFCSRCGKMLDLSQVFRNLTGGESGSTLTAGRDRGTSKYKSARKARR